DVRLFILPSCGCCQGGSSAPCTFYDCARREAWKHDAHRWPPSVCGLRTKMPSDGGTSADRSTIAGALDGRPEGGSAASESSPEWTLDRPTKIGPCDHDARDAMPARRMTGTLPS